MKNRTDLITTSRIAVFLLLLVFIFFVPQPQEVKAKNQAKIFLSPSTGSFLVGSTFDVSIVVDTDEAYINTVKVDLDFPADNLQIVSPSSGQSFVSLWLEQPTYSNIEGTISFAGGKPEGIKTSSGIVSTIIFRVIKAGEVVIKILPSSSVLAHDGKGTQVLSTVISGRYVLKPRPPEGPEVFSATHPDETSWCNNNNPIISWETEEGVTFFSFVLDVYPQTVPDNTFDNEGTTKAYEDLPDGLRYFHIKAQKNGVWGAPSHFLLRIDTTPPARFTPKVDFLLATIIGRAFVSFSTTDALSGLDHYEIAVIDKTKPPLESPVFIEAQSPYQLPRDISENLRVIVRASDKAGNVRDEFVDVDLDDSIFTTLKDNIATILGIAIIAAFLIFLITPLRLRREIIIFSEGLVHKIFSRSMEKEGATEELQRKIEDQRERERIIELNKESEVRKMEEEARESKGERPVNLTFRIPQVLKFSLWQKIVARVLIFLVIILLTSFFYWFFTVR